MMKIETLDLELKTFNHTRTECIFLTNKQFEVLDVVATSTGSNDGGIHY